MRARSRWSRRVVDAHYVEQYLDARSTCGPTIGGATGLTRSPWAGRCTNAGTSRLDRAQRHVDATATRLAPRSLSAAPRCQQRADSFDADGHGTASPTNLYQSGLRDAGQRVHQHGHGCAAGGSAVTAGQSLRRGGGSVRRGPGWLSLQVRRWASAGGLYSSSVRGKVVVGAVTSFGTGAVLGLQGAGAGAHARFDAGERPDERMAGHTEASSVTVNGARGTLTNQGTLTLVKVHDQRAVE